GIHPRLRTDAFRFDDEGFASGILMEQASKEGKADGQAIGPEEAIGYLSVGFSGRDPFEDAWPASLVLDLALDEAFDRLGSHGATYQPAGGDAISVSQLGLDSR